VLAVLALAAITLYNFNTSKDLENHSFDAWKAKYQKIYSSTEEAYRIGIWIKN